MQNMENAMQQCELEVKIMQSMKHERFTKLLPHA